MIRTNIDSKRMAPEQVVGTYKRLSSVERAFRSFKKMDLRARPVHHRLEHRVRAHVLCCMLAYYVEHCMRGQLAPLLFDDAHKPVHENPVALPDSSASALNEAAHKVNCDGLRVQSFRNLLKHLSGLTRNRVQLDGECEFDMLSRPTAVQSEAFRLLGVRP